MRELTHTHPEVYRRFREEYHVVRRSDRYWTRLSTDLIIEQVLMRSLKTSGCLTRGSGMSEIQRTVWLLSMSIGAEVNDAIQYFTNAYLFTCEQHRDASSARQSRDVSDTLEILNYLSQRNPFSPDNTLHSIANGMTADKTVNVDQFKNVGNKILNYIAGKKVDEHSFKRSDQAVPLGAGKIGDESQRLVMVIREREDTLASVFSYELCSHLPALFESSCLPLEADKPVIEDAL
ncbi:uncharacterized protein LOC110464230 [Mizuhopecten yessoensis]|uniref:uncharacterized protein LOC110464230 n=1 Tax=Mizuhopecten yessoensis TaxID=6573 RepID=UPI000B459E73|nr:uncharacterized protein LOC110464230 [Mizuhopecten yessoensis]